MTNPKALANEPAFPKYEKHFAIPSDAPQSVRDWVREFNFPAEGLSKREYFAAMAMQGMLAHTEAGANPPKAMAKFSVEFADALLAELAKEKANA